MATEPQHSEIMSGAPSSSEPAGVSADAALIVAALGRIEAAVRDQGVVLGRLRSALGDMAQAIANAKTVADSETAAAMLDEFEHRVDAMIEIAGGAPVTNPAGCRRRGLRKQPPNPIGCRPSPASCCGSALARPCPSRPLRTLHNRPMPRATKPPPSRC